MNIHKCTYIDISLFFFQGVSFLYTCTVRVMLAMLILETMLPSHKYFHTI